MQRERETERQRTTIIERWIELVSRSIEMERARLTSAISPVRVPGVKTPGGDTSENRDTGETRGEHKS